MDYFNYKNDEYYAEDVAVKKMAATYGTPLFVYSQQTIKHHLNTYIKAFGNSGHKLCYSVKVNSNLSILKMMVKMGTGFDIVSKGELQKVIMAGAKGSDIVFSGVGKTTDELEFALENNIYCFNVESYPELLNLQKIAAKQNKQAPVAIRVNPDIDAKTHPYISTGMSENKFGLNIDEAIEAYKFAKNSKNLKIIGIDCHIGSQITTIKPYEDATDKLLNLVQKLKDDLDIDIEHIDLGGGLGVCYDDENPPSVDIWINSILTKIPKNMKLILEPGRSIMANAGILLSQIIYIKKNKNKNFIITDSGMNDLIRPSLYQAYHKIIPAIKNSGEKITADIVGPICESTDFSGKNRNIQCQPNDILVTRTVGAYGFCMASNYNIRPRSAEVMVDKNSHKIIRHRESIDDLIKNEIIE
ncbi:MAG: diaminopimelate decarboxylase [Gammaproteobacteria bacterium]|nr:MAG: diaminopimelate decarboxylase [Gammaproteobacteria bacterium]